MSTTDALLGQLEAYANTLPVRLRYASRYHGALDPDTAKAMRHAADNPDAPRFTITRDLAGEYEVRTLLGDVGRGEDLADALAELLEDLGIIKQRAHLLRAA